MVSGNGCGCFSAASAITPGASGLQDCGGWLPNPGFNDGCCNNVVNATGIQSFASTECPDAWRFPTFYQGTIGGHLLGFCLADQNSEM